MTHTKEQLILTYTHQHQHYNNGSPNWMTPSQFLQKIPPNMITNLSTLPSLLSYQQQSHQQNNKNINLLNKQNKIHETIDKKLYNNPTYNSINNLTNFFSNHNLTIPKNIKQPQPKNKITSKTQNHITTIRHPPLSHNKGHIQNNNFHLNTQVHHQKFNINTIMKSKNNKTKSKITIHFQNHNIKKLQIKFTKLVPT